MVAIRFSIIVFMAAFSAKNIITIGRIAQDKGEEGDNTHKHEG
jgi:hypothetical protein